MAFSVNPECDEAVTISLKIYYNGLFSVIFRIITP